MLLGTIAVTAFLLGVLVGHIFSVPASSPVPSPLPAPSRDAERSPDAIPDMPRADDSEAPEADVSELARLRDQLRATREELERSRREGGATSRDILNLWLEDTERLKLIRNLYHEEAAVLEDEVREHVNSLFETRVRRLDELRERRLDAMLPDFERLSSEGFRNLFEQFYGYCLRGERTDEAIADLWMRLADGYRLYLDSHRADRGRLIRTWLSLRGDLTDREWQGVRWEFNLSTQELREHGR